MEKSGYCVKFECTLFSFIILHSSLFLSPKDVHNDPLSFVVPFFYAILFLSTQAMLRPPEAESSPIYLVIQVRMSAPVVE